VHWVGFIYKIIQRCTVNRIWNLTSIYSIYHIIAKERRNLLRPRKSRKDKRDPECYGTGTTPKYSIFKMMIIMMKFVIFCVIPNYKFVIFCVIPNYKFVIFCVIPNYKLFNFSSQISYIIYTHLNNMDFKQLRSEFSLYCVHIVIFSVKVIAVCQAETCRWIKAEIKKLLCL
jgi:hypothetical protein